MEWVVWCNGWSCAGALNCTKKFKRWRLWFGAVTGHVEVIGGFQMPIATAVEVPAGSQLNTHPVANGLCGQHVELEICELALNKCHT